MATAPITAEPQARTAGSWQAIAIAVGGIASLAAIAATIGRMPPVGLAIGVAAASALMLLAVPIAGRARRPHRVAAEPGEAGAGGLDWGLVAAALGEGPDALVVTDSAGQPRCANRAYEILFDGVPNPFGLAVAESDAARITAAAREAWRTGEAATDTVSTTQGVLLLRITRAGSGEDYLIWRFSRDYDRDPLSGVIGLVDGPAGRRLGAAGIMAAAIDGDGRIHAANPVFIRRALGGATVLPEGIDVLDLLVADRHGQFRFDAEGAEAAPVRVLHVPARENEPEGAAMLLLIDEDAAPQAHQAASESVYTLLAMLPLGLALAERDGRFLFMNAAFGRAAGVSGQEGVLYPSDLVVDEDKATVSEAVRRFAQGRALPGDLAVRLRAKPEEPVAMTIAGATGLGDAAVLLSLKDNSEESKLKRQVAQATKMQAVGQLAGGVAHDFNNVLTAIIGHCDLMLMRHSPGDIDHDDIQQIKLNSNRAASLTRQLLAFSRQQTLRPQVLQLPDVISEVSHLLKRLLGETITLTVKHGRNLGFVRADPGQLEQVIVNLAVNARDAMPDGGTLSVQTYAMSAAEVRKMGSDILPVADYVALSVSDTGHGIPIEIQGKIFEPFFTTKEVGKGTGLGLSTVYGIVKQTGGFIFAESAPGQGTRFVIYLPVEQAAGTAAAQPKEAKVEPAGDLWGTGTILLVEDEAMVRSVAERALSRQGYRVLTATNGEEALEQIAGGEQIDLLISDVVMPTMDGPTLVRHARERMPDVPVLFMSGYAEEQLRRSIDIASVAFLPKPFSIQQLCAAARDTLAAAKG